MGWLFYTARRVKSYADENAEITRLCTFDTDTRNTELIKACKVGSTWYAAAKVTGREGSPLEDATYVTDADGSFTFGAVFLTRYDDGCWGYKDVEESAGPVESRAPLSILALLSDLKDPDSYAHAWRQHLSNRDGHTLQARSAEAALLPRRGNRWPCAPVKRLPCRVHPTQLCQGCGKPDPREILCRAGVLKLFSDLTNSTVYVYTFV